MPGPSGVQTWTPERDVEGIQTELADPTSRHTLTLLDRVYRRARRLPERPDDPMEPRSFAGASARDYSLPRFSLMMSMTFWSARVVESPASRPSAMSRSRRRMILPERVLGSSLTIRICFGLAIGPIWVATC